MFRLWRMSRVNWSKINIHVWAISDITWSIIRIRENIGFVRSNSWRLKSTYCILRRWQSQTRTFKRLGNITFIHYTARMIFLNRAYWSSVIWLKLFFSDESILEYFMVIKLFHNPYFTNSAQWKTSVLLPRDSCIYLHNWQVDGIFLFKLQVCNCAEHSLMLVTVNSRSQQWILQ